LLLVLSIVATAFGTLVIYSATRSYAGADNYVRIQVIAAALGVFLFVILSLVDIDLITDHWVILLIFNVVFISTLFIWGVEGDTGNKNWLRFEGIGVGIQPSEIVKITFTLLLAKQLTYLRDQSRGGLSSVLSVGMLLGHFGLIFGLILLSSNDLGSGLVYVFIFLVMLFAGGLKKRWFAFGLLIMGAVSPFLWTSFLSENQRNRILAPYIPAVVDPTGKDITWQATQSKIALASGRLFGQGFLQGKQSQGSNLPYKHTDFIFSVVGEEFGLIGCIAVVVLLLLIIWRCVWVGVRSGNRMKMLYCIGVAAMLTFQTFENVGMCIGITPVIGLTLPFFSYGGSSILSTIAALGVVSGIRRSTA
jgi:rod shape determining protein RodA